MSLTLKLPLRGPPSPYEQLWHDASVYFLHNRDILCNEFVILTLPGSYQKLQDGETVNTLPRMRIPLTSRLSLFKPPSVFQKI